MTKTEIIEHLTGMLEYSADNAAAFDSDEVWAKDVEVLTEVIAILREEKPDEWFGVVRWCDDDIRAGLRDAGFRDDDDSVGLIHDKLANSSALTGGMIERGWDFIAYCIDECADDLTPIEEEVK